MTATEELSRRGWEPHQVRELAQHLGRDPAHARQLEQYARQVARAKAMRRARR